MIFIYILQNQFFTCPKQYNQASGAYMKNITVKIVHDFSAKESFLIKFNYLLLLQIGS